MNAQRPSPRPSNEAIAPHLIEMAGRTLIEIGRIPERYEDALREAISRADEAEATDLDFYLRGRR